MRVITSIKTRKGTTVIDWQAGNSKQHILDILETVVREHKSEGIKRVKISIYHNRRWIKFSGTPDAVKRQIEEVMSNEEKEGTI